MITVPPAGDRAVWRFVRADPVLFPIDSNGNLTQKVEGTDTWGYEWNANNELTRVTKNSVEQARFSYDPAGRRAEKVAGGVTTGYTYDRSNILREVRGSTTLKYVHGPAVDEPLAVDDGTALSYYHPDGLGSLVKTTNAAGAVTLTRQYDAWGYIEVGGSTSGYAFTSREWDAEIGAYYYRARYYDPKVGRFVSEDPIGFLGGANFSTYAENRPTNRRDPSGLASTGGCCGQGYLGCLANCIERYDPFNWLQKMVLTGAGGTVPWTTAGKFGGGVARTSIPSLAVHAARRAGINVPGQVARVARGVGDFFSWSFIVYGDAMAAVEIGCAIACAADVCSY